MAALGLAIGISNFCDAWLVWRHREWKQPLARRLAFFQFRRSFMRALSFALALIVGLVVVLPMFETVRGLSIVLLVIILTSMTVSEFLERLETMSFNHVDEEVRNEDA
jgi:hypothetical protein